MSYLNIKFITGVVSDLKRTYGTSNPYELCSVLGIILLYHSMGTLSDSCKGFYFTHLGVNTITINSDLPEIIQKVILAHELGHAKLHGNGKGEAQFHEFALFDEVSRKEYEANIFAAELLLEDSEVLELLNEEGSFFQAAAKLNVPPEILDFKFRILKRKGYKLIDPPTYADSRFLRNNLGGEEYYEC